MTDFVVIVWAVIGTQIAWFGTLSSELNVGQYTGGFGLNYTLISVVLIISWSAILAMFGTRDSRVIGTGTNEYKRLVDATVRLFGIVAIIAFLFQLDLARGYIVMALPIGSLALLASRWMWRQWLSAQRARGLYSSRVLLVGSRVSVTAIARELLRLPEAGYLVVGACVPGDAIGEYLYGRIPVSGNLDQLQSAMEASGADTVVVTSSDELPPERIRQLSWSLEPGRQHLVLAPSLTDVGGPRIHMRPVAGLPLIHVETPRYEGLKRFSKRAFDIVSSSILIAVLSPVLIAAALGVRLSTPGGVIFKQDRVGLNGEHFQMLKFRSMVVDAEARLAELGEVDRAEGNTVMFKMKNDPRVTPIGGFLRRFSLDELPQLFNVLSGSMSLVGPRPPLDREVAVYEHHVHRRFLVKPGITGLWQVSGRSNLSWEDTVRLDLYYVENWSITGDLLILWRTARAVVARDGAY
ncbi:sugar transferase [Glaciihabitans tibetensis]|uniref:sugar transferase n=1 Tax=Glaciihabitans tibetensis TaxID=1266600 RepID=UPI001FEB58DB|nr:sugar transferase [Glaciihabitans tibetensis]